MKLTNSQREPDGAVYMYEGAFRRTTPAVIVYRDEGVIYTSQGMRELIGYRQEEISKMNFWDFVHPEHRDLIRDRGLARQRGVAIPHHYNFKIVNKAGQAKWVYFTGEMTTFVGNPAGFGVLRELSQKAISEDKLGIFAGASDGIVLMDQQGSIISWNAGMKRITGLSFVDAVGKKAIDVAALLTPKKGEQRTKFHSTVCIARHAFQLKNDEEHILLEFPIERPDQSFLHVHLSLFTVRIEDRLIFAGITRDVSEYPVTDERVAAIDKRYQSLFENTVEGIFQTTSSGIFLNANPSFARMLGYDTEEELLDSVRDIAHDLCVDPDDRDDFLRKLRQQGTVRDHELRYRRKDGAPIWVSINAKAALSSDGSIKFIDGFVQDISDRKRLEQQLIQSQKMEAVGRLAGGIAHDFNNILTVIMGNCELLQGTYNGQDKGSEELDGIKKAVTFAAALTCRLLAFSRQQVLTPRVLNVNSVIQNLELILKRLIGENIRLVLTLDPSLGRVEADPSQLEQVILNLAINARDAMPNGGQMTLSTANLSLAYKGQIVEPHLKPGKYVLLHISDTGIGMSQDTLDHLFEPFFTTKTLGHGTGLGLSTVHGIVSQSGGTITVTTTLEKGSCFTVTLPQIEDELPPETEAHADEISGRNGTILVVEDDETVRKLSCKILRNAGYTIIESGDGCHALELLDDRAQSIEMVLTDVMMPRMGGGKLEEAIRKKDQKMPVLFISGYAEGDLGFQDVPSGWIGFLPKPFSKNDLLSKVRVMLDSARNSETKRSEGIS